MQIRELENTLQAALFERSARHVRLTGIGELLLGRARAILRSVDDLSELAQAAQGWMTGRLRIGVIPTIAPYLLPQVIRALTGAHPQLDIHVRESLTQTLLEELAEGRLDTAILALPVAAAGLVEKPLFSEAFVLVRPASDALKPAPDIDALRDMRVLLLEEGHCFRDQALALCNLQPARAREVLDGSALSTLVQMVGAGIGVTLIPEIAVPVETRSATVDVVRFDDPPPSRQIGMVWRASSPLGGQLADIAQIVAQAATDLRGTGTVTPARGLQRGAAEPGL